jgi:amino acid permease
VALVLPYVAELVGLVGALLTMSISLILPALMHLLLLGAELPLWQKCLDVAVLALGIVCAVAGASSAAANLQAKVAAAAAVVA